MTGYEPPEDPSEAPTGYYDYGDKEQGDPEQGKPWYRRPIISLTVGLFAAILLGMALYLLADRTQRHRRYIANPDLADDTNRGADRCHRGHHDHRAGRSGVDRDDRPAPQPPSRRPPGPASRLRPPEVEGRHHHHHHHDGGTP